MIVLTIMMTLVAVGWTAVVFMANAMRSAPVGFQHGSQIAVAWIVAAIFWLGWWLD